MPFPRPGRFYWSFIIGSFIIGSFIIGSFIIGSFIIGSFIIGSFIIGHLSLVIWARGLSRAATRWCLRGRARPTNDRASAYRGALRLRASHLEAQAQGLGAGRTRGNARRRVPVTGDARA